MIWKKSMSKLRNKLIYKFTYKVIKWLTLLFCLFTVLLTTPFGSQLTIRLLNNIDGIHADYKAGSIVRDLELNSFHLNLDNLEIRFTDLVSEIDFSCSWRKTLCIDTLQASTFSLTYVSDDLNENLKHNLGESLDENVNTNSDTNPSMGLAEKSAVQVQGESTESTIISIDDSLFIMPFGIEAHSVTFGQSKLTINQTVIDIEEFTAQVDIKVSQFTVLKPTATTVSITPAQNTANGNTARDNTAINCQTPSRLKTESCKSSNHINNKIKQTANSIYTAFNTLPKISLPISLDIQELFVNQIRIIKHNTASTLTNLAKWPYQQNHLTGTWSKSEVNITNFKTSTLDFEIKQSALHGELIPPYKINGKLLAQLHKIPKWQEASDSIVNLSLQGAFDNLQVNITSKGSVILHSKGKINLTHQQLPFTLQLSANKLPLPLSLSQYAKPSSLSLDMSGDLVEQELNLISQLNSYGYKDALLKLSAKHKQGLVTLDELTFNEQAVDSPLRGRLKNQLNIHGSIDFQPETTSWQLFAGSSGFTLPQISLKGLMPPNKTNNKPISNAKNTQANSNINTENQSEVLQSILPPFIKGRVLGEIATTGFWAKSNWSLVIEDTHVSGTINDSALIINGAIAINQSGYLSPGDSNEEELLIGFGKDKLVLQTSSNDNWHVNAQLTIAEIKRWYPLVSGSINSNFTIRGYKEDPVISLKTQFAQLNWQHIYSPFVDVTATYQPFHDNKTQLTITNEIFEITDKSNNLSLQDIFLNFSGDSNKQQFQLEWQGDLAGKLKFSSQWHKALNQWQSTINQAALSYKKQKMHIDKAFSLNVNISNQQLFIEQHCWQGTGLSLCLSDDAIVGEAGDLAIGLNIDLSLLDEMMLPEEVQLQSKISGVIKTQWSPIHAISAQANLSLSPGNITINDEYNAQQISQWHQGELSFKMNESRVTSRFQLQDLHEKELIHINSTLSLLDDFPIEAQINLNQFNLQPFQALISNVVNLQGLVTSNLSVNGTVTVPKFNGNLAIDNGELLLSQNPNKLEKISAKLHIVNNHVQMAGNFFIKDNKAIVDGLLDWNKGLTTNIDLHAEQLPLAFPPQLVMKVSPQLNFSVKDKVLTISGNLDVLEGNYNIEKLPQGSIDLSDDVVIINEQGKEVLKEKTGLAIKTNVSINIAKAFTVSGQGLASNLLGQLKVTQQQKQPLQLFGNIQSVDGIYQAYGQKLTIEKGELTFNGPLTNPYFNLRASRHIKAEDIEVGLQITGLADALDMQLFSNPTMEAPEMLSYLARGRGLDSGGGSSTAAASMLIGFGVTNSVGLFDQLEKIPLISNIAVDTEGEGDATQATISGYVGNRVYLKYGIGVYEPINELTVRLFLLNRLWLEIVSGIEQSSDIYYSFDID